MSAARRLREARKAKSSGLQLLDSQLIDVSSSSVQMSEQDREQYLLDLQYEQSNQKDDYRFARGNSSESEEEPTDTQTKNNQPKISSFIGISSKKKRELKEDPSLLQDLDATFGDDDDEESEMEEPIAEESYSSEFMDQDSIKPPINQPVSDDIINIEPNQSVSQSPKLSFPKGLSSPPRIGKVNLPQLNKTKFQKDFKLGESLSAFIFEICEENNSIFLFGKLPINQTYRSITCRVTNCVKHFYIETSIESKPQVETILYSIFNRFKIESVNLINCFGENNLGDNQHKHFFKISYLPATDIIQRTQLPLTTEEFIKLLNIEPSSLPFSNVYGLSYSLYECFVLEKSFEGPGWFDFDQFKSLSSSSGYSDVILEVDSDNVKLSQGNFETPELSGLFVSFRSVLDSSNNHVPVAFSLVYSDEKGQYDRSKSLILIRPLTSKDSSQSFDSFTVANNVKAACSEINGISVIQCTDEGQLLSKMIDHVSLVDPDFLSGHAIVDFLIPIIIDRVSKLRSGLLGAKIPWFKLGRLNRGQNELKKGFDQVKKLTTGRLIIDTILGSREFLTKMKSFDLSEISFSIFKEHRDPSDSETTRNLFGSSFKVTKLLNQCLNDSFLSQRISSHLNLIPLTFKLAKITGSPWSDVLLSGRSRRIEWLLLHRFKSDFVIPDRRSKKKDDDGTKKTASYAGGLVLEPKRGLYTTYVMVLDFLSLYPSIIQEFDVCFTTMKPSLDGQVVHNSEKGVLPAILKELIVRRRSVKQEIKTLAQKSKNQQDSFLMDQLNVEQLAIKLVANSIYGCLGFSSARFFAKPLAAFITNCGREILKKTIEKTNDLGFDVVYGDTDSIMVDSRTSKLAEALAIADKVTNTINKSGSHLELELDYLFSKILLLRKKKYAALAVELDLNRTFKGNKLEVKGIDLVRRDWCLLSKQLSTEILDVIFGSDSSDPNYFDTISFKILDKLKSTAEQLRNGEIPLESLAVYKELKTLPQNYTTKDLPHVAVALRMQAKGFPVSSSSVIPYLIATSSSPEFQGSTGLSARARMISEVKPNGEDDLDLQYYLKSQLLAPISRLVEVIEGIDPSMLADALGIEHKSVNSNANCVENSVIPSKYIEPQFVVNCKCSTQYELTLESNIVNFVDSFSKSPLPLNQENQHYSCISFLERYHCPDCSDSPLWEDVERAILDLINLYWTCASKSPWVCSQCSRCFSNLDPSKCTCEDTLSRETSMLEFGLVVYFCKRFVSIFRNDQIAKDLIGKLDRLSTRVENCTVDLSTLSPINLDLVEKPYVSISSYDLL
ncbi:hypothetical protein P9112_007652 [Eukaryota sp. TZLM1-RC]